MIKRIRKNEQQNIKQIVNDHGGVDHIQLGCLSVYSQKHEQKFGEITMTIYCLYHESDLDGKCSGAIVYDYFKARGEEVIMVPMNYNKEIEIIPDIDEEDKVFFVDFSLPIEDMIMLNNMCDLYVIDHHKTLIDSINKLKLDFNGIQEIGTGACELVWRYFYKEDVPYGIKLMARYDVWDHSDPNTLPFQYGMDVRDTTPTSTTWKLVFADNDDFISDVLSDGDAIGAYVDNKNTAYCNFHAFPMSFEGYNCVAMNISLTSSLAFKAADPDDIYDIYIAFSYTSNKKWYVSLYTNRDNINVGELAKKYGGGGHRNAAGFVCDENPFGIK